MSASLQHLSSLVQKSPYFRTTTGPNRQDACLEQGQGEDGEGTQPRFGGQPSFGDYERHYTGTSRLRGTVFSIALLWLSAQGLRGDFGISYAGIYHSLGAIIEANLPGQPPQHQGLLLMELREFVVRSWDRFAHATVALEWLQWLELTWALDDAGCHRRTCKVVPVASDERPRFQGDARCGGFSSK